MRNLLLTLLTLTLLTVGVASASSIAPLSISSNTPYQNTNATSPLYIYALSTTTAGTYTAAYVGPTSSNLIYVANTVSVITGVGGVGITQKTTTTIVVPPLWYYQFNYTGSDQFEGMYSNQTSASSASPIILPLPNVVPPSGFPWDMVLIIIALVCFVLAIIADRGSMPQMALYLLSAVTMWIGVNYGLIPSYPSVVQVPQITAGNVIIHSFNITLAQNTNPQPTEAYSRSLFGYIYVALCIILLVAGALSRGADYDIPKPTGGIRENR